MPKKTSLKTKLGQYLVQNGHVKLRDVNRCLQMQKRCREQGKHYLLGQVLLSQKLVAGDVLNQALAAIGALVAYCPRCQVEAEQVRYQPGKQEFCSQCRALLVYKDRSEHIPRESERPKISAPDPRGEDTTLTADPAKDPLINRIIGGCEILERIARGGMGVVYRAKQLNLGRTVAVKILAEKLAADVTFVRRFVHEARAAAELNHGNIVHIIDVGQFEGIFYFTMEYVDGASLAMLLKHTPRLELTRTVEIGRQACQALQHAHGKNIIHRDIKPENIMITSDGVVKLADLGLAKRVTDGEIGLTQTGAVFGTPHYMAPEQAKDFRNVDKRSDIYSLGVTLYRAITGRVPFAGKTALEVMIKACSGDKRPIRELRPEVPEAYEALVHRMMHPDPEQRFQDVREVINGLGMIVARYDLAPQR